jgi:hypothetical protein
MAKVVTLFWPLRLMLPPAETPRLAIVIAPEPETAPVVRRARVEKFAGVIAVATVMSPLFEPPAAPSRKVPAVKIDSSLLLMSRVPEASVPEALRLMTLLFVVGFTVITPEVFTKAVETPVNRFPVILIAPALEVMSPPVL